MEWPCYFIIVIIIVILSNIDGVMIILIFLHKTNLNTKFCSFVYGFCSMKNIIYRNKLWPLYWKTHFILEVKCICLEKIPIISYNILRYYMGSKTFLYAIINVLDDSYKQVFLDIWSYNVNNYKETRKHLFLGVNFVLQVHGCIQW